MSSIAFDQLALVHHPVKAGPKPDVAGSAIALWQDLDPDGILITVHAKFGDLLYLATGLALFP